MKYIVDNIALLEKFRICFEAIPPRKWRFLHKRSVENCIKYINTIKGTGDKKICFDSLENYFSYIDHYSNYDDIDIALSADLYKAYLQKLETIYTVRVGFATAYPIRLILLISIPIFCLLYFLAKYNLTIFFIFSFVIFSFIIYILRKTLQGKVMGFGY